MQITQSIVIKLISEYAILFFRRKKEGTKITFQNVVEDLPLTN
jgi:hypothetical protein